MDYNIKSIKERFKKEGIFYTPPELAIMMKEYIGFNPENVYDPTCGDGSLLSMFDDNVEKYGQEINNEQLNIAKNRLINFNGFWGDTLTNPGFKDKKFDCIMANPPFSIEWIPQMDKRFSDCGILAPKSKADYAFILHCLHYLSDSGVAIILCFPGILYRGNSEAKIREWLIKQNYIEKIISIPGNTFVDTKISTVLLVLSKHKTNTDILFDDKSINKERLVKISEIENNDYNLSINSYIQEEKEELKINPIELQNKARNSFIKKLKAELVFDKEICNIEGIDFNQYLNQIKKVIDEFGAKNER